MITSVRFKNFKGLQAYSLALRQTNVLVGPNNSGKSTILDAFRILGGAYRYASRFNPAWISLSGGNSLYGYQIPRTSIPITTDNIHTDYNDEETTVSFRFDAARQLKVTFTREGRILLTMETPRRTPATASAFRKEFPLSLAIVPTLGPFEPEEEIAQAEYVARWARSHRAPRLFRNMWYYENGDFETFKMLIENSWAGMSISLPERADTLSDRLVMFCSEDRLTREITWIGYGFQVWLQLLTHIVKSSNADLIVVDEPEIYLHPDLQRKIVQILKSTGPQILIATHSVEIINEVETEDVLLVDRAQQSATRIVDVVELQRAVDILGSTQNIHLARLARAKRVLFVEGKDRKILERLAALAGYPQLFTNDDITAIPIGGFSEWNRVLHASWTFSQVLGEPLRCAALFDRDYSCQAEIDAFVEKLQREITYVHVHVRKEIENYLLVPCAIERAINRKLRARYELGQLAAIPTVNIEELLEHVTDSLRGDVFGQLAASEVRYLRSTGTDAATILTNQHGRFEALWDDLSSRLAIVPGKTVLSALNQEIQGLWGISISPPLITSYMRIEDIADDLKEFFSRLESFRVAQKEEPLHP